MKKRPIYFLVILFVIFLNGCKYDFILPEEASAVVVPAGTSVSFATQIAPIFTAAGCVSCHGTGGQSPDLTAANAYSQVISKVVNTASPETSLLYAYPSPANTAVHSWKKYTSGQAALVLAWIKDGAKNN